jgi:hypothetical protein
MKHNPATRASDENIAVLAIIEAAGPKGITTAEIGKMTGYESSRIYDFIKRMRASRKVAPILKPGVMNQRYVTIRHFGVHLEASGLFTNLPPRTTSVTVIKSTGPRNSTVSPERLAIEAVLAAATAPLSVEMICLVSDVDIHKTRAILTRMRHDGMATNLGERVAMWQRTGARVPKVEREQRVCNGNQPAMPAGYLSSMNPVRPGADDHLKYQSRGF